MTWVLFIGLILNLIGSVLIGITVIKNKTKIRLLAERRSSTITKTSLRRDAIMGTIGLGLLMFGFLGQIVYVYFENFSCK